MNNENNVTNETVNNANVQTQEKRNSSVNVSEAEAVKVEVSLIDWTEFFTRIEAAMMNTPSATDKVYVTAKENLAELLTYAVMRDQELFFIDGVPVADCKMNDKLAAMFTVTWRLEFYDRYSGPNFKGDAHLVKLNHAWDDYVKALAVITKRINPKFRVNGGGVMFHNNEETITTGTAYLSNKGAINLGSEANLLPWVIDDLDKYTGTNITEMKVYQKKLGQHFVDIVNALPSSQS